MKTLGTVEKDLKFLRSGTFKESIPGNKTLEFARDTFGLGAKGTRCANVAI